MKIKQTPQILASKYQTWNGKPPDETSGLRPQTKILAGPAAEKVNTEKLKIYHQDELSSWKK